MDATGITDALKHLTGLDVSLYGLAIVLGVGLRFARAYWVWCAGAHTLAVAGVLAMLGAGLQLSMESHPWQFIALQCISLFVAVLIAERILRGLAGKVPGLPADNEFVKPPTGGNP